MAGATRVLDTTSQSVTNYDYSKIILSGFDALVGKIVNGTASERVIPAGQVMGRIAATGNYDVLASAATNGTQYPLAINLYEVTIPAGAAIEADIHLAKECTVDEGKLVFDGSDDLDTVIDARIIRDRMENDARIILRKVTELSKTDNQ